MTATSTRRGFGSGAAVVVAALLGACGNPVPKITALDRASHAPRFPIAEGNHASADCNACHGEFDSFTEFSCLGCHEHAQAATDAIHGGLVGYAYESARCLECHPAGDAENVDHDQFFPIGEGTNHPDRTCANCHTGSSRKEFSCLGCHLQPETDPKHGGISGYAYDSPHCYSCHPRGEASGIDHGPIFPIEPGSKHGEVACGECHVNPASREEVACNTCHVHPGPTVAAKHGQVGGFADTYALCERCHADSQVDRVSAHLPFGITSGFKHYRTSCLACHPAVRGDKPFAAADFSKAKVDCLSCHRRAQMDDQHSEVAGYRYETQTCLVSGCHANGRKPRD